MPGPASARRSTSSSRRGRGPGPFAFDGEFYQLPYVNPWPRPLQQPHPPVWIPGLGSPSTITYCVEHGFGYMGVAYYAPPETFARQAHAYRRRRGERRPRTFDPELLGWLTTVYVAETDEQAVEEAAAHLAYFQGTLAAGFVGPGKVWMPPGYIDPPALVQFLADLRAMVEGPRPSDAGRRGVEALAADREPGHGPGAAARLGQRAGARHRAGALAVRVVARRPHGPLDASVRHRGRAVRAGARRQAFAHRGGYDRRRAGRAGADPGHGVGVGPTTSTVVPGRHRATPWCTCTGCATSTPPRPARRGHRCWPGWPSALRGHRPRPAGLQRQHRPGGPRRRGGLRVAPRRPVAGAGARPASTSSGTASGDGSPPSSPCAGPSS